MSVLTQILYLGGLTLTGFAVHDFCTNGKHGPLSELGEALERLWFPNYHWEGIHPTFTFQHPTTKYPYKRALVPCAEPWQSFGVIPGPDSDWWQARFVAAVDYYRNPANGHPEYSDSDDRLPELYAKIVNECHHESYDAIREAGLQPPPGCDGGRATLKIYDSSDGRDDHYKNCAPLGEPLMVADQRLRDGTPVQGVGGVPADAPYAVPVKKYILGRLLGEGTEDVADHYLQTGGDFDTLNIWNRELFANTPFVTREALETMNKYKSSKGGGPDPGKCLEEIMDKRLYIGHLHRDGQKEAFQAPAIFKYENYGNMAPGWDPHSILAGAEPYNHDASLNSSFYSLPPVEPWNVGFAWTDDGTWRYNDESSVDNNGSTIKLAQQHDAQAASYVLRHLARDQDGPFGVTDGYRHTMQTDHSSVPLEYEPAWF